MQYYALLCSFNFYYYTSTSNYLILRAETDVSDETDRSSWEIIGVCVKYHTWSCNWSCAIYSLEMLFERRIAPVDLSVICRNMLLFSRVSQCFSKRTSLFAEHVFALADIICCNMRVPRGIDYARLRKCHYRQRLRCGNPFDEIFPFDEIHCCNLSAIDELLGLLS